MSRGVYLLNLGCVPYREAWDLQCSLAAVVSQGVIPDTALFLEHPSVITLGWCTEEGELHVSEGVVVEIVETDRGGKSIYHGFGQFVCYPIFDLIRHGQDVKRYCRDLEEVLIRVLAAVGVEATRIEGLTGIWVDGSILQKIASIGVYITKWVTMHGYVLNVDLDTTSFTEWIIVCGFADVLFTTIACELGRSVIVDELRLHVAKAFEDVFDLAFEEFPTEDGVGLWSQPIHEHLTAKPTGAASSGKAQGVEQVVARS